MSRPIEERLERLSARRNDPEHGSRARPITVTGPEDLAAAAARAQQPSQAQARAGNYSLAHVIVGGLDVSIESPMGSIRSGVAPNGERWSVRLPADYGYIKRTVGADGDHLDVYLGPMAHAAHTLPVWVVDQCDADTKAFDEHKVLIGFPDSASARHTYLSAFSDGRGRDRVQRVCRLSFQEFKERLKTDWAITRTAKSASSNVVSSTYSHETCPCAGPCACNGSFGGTMTTHAGDEKAASSVSLITKILGSVLPGMSQKDRLDLLQDAATQGTLEIGKAVSMLEGEGIPQVEDLWAGNPDDALRIGGGSGPNTSAPSGSVNVGPSQAASGNGAERMEAHYSQPTPQSGVQRATEKLGRDIAGVRAAMKSFLTAFNTVNTQMTVMKSAIASVPDTAAIQTLVDAAVSKAIAEATVVSSAKFASLDAEITKAKALLAVKLAAKEEGEDGEAKEDEDGADHMAKAFPEMDEEDEEDGKKEDKKEAAKSAAILRLQAKSRLKWASRRINAARDLAEGGDVKAAGDMRALAEVNLAKAAGYVEASRLMLGKAGNSSKAITTAIGKAKEKVAENQKTWPTSKSEDRTASVDIAKAVEQITAAANGMGMMTASVSELMSALSKGNSSGSGSAALPPVFALAKAGASSVTAMETELTALRDSHVITDDHLELSRDAIMRARMGLPKDTIEVLIARLPPQAQAVLTRVAA